MSYLVAIFAVVGLVLAGLLVMLRRRKRSDRQAMSGIHSALLTPGAQLAKLKQNGKFYGVSVESHCHASSQLVGERYTFDNAPDLPVPGCEADICKCRFVGVIERRKLPTRRSGGDRRESMRLDSEERRSGIPRRQSERDAWDGSRHD